jgi:hypothetical protein
MVRRIGGERVKKLAIFGLLVIASACQRQATAGGQGVDQPGAASARGALDLFLATAKAQDLYAMSMIWGSSKGPARSTMKRSDLEKREVILMRCLRHDRYQVLSEAPATGGERVFTVELAFRTLVRSSNFTATPGPRGRWYLKQVDDIDNLQAICASI